jgi:cell division septum initiation protein DivIVA
MRDRTFEKPHSAGTASASSGNRRPAGNAGVAQFTQNFFQEAKETREMIKTLHEYVNRLGSLHDSMLNAIREAERIAYQRKSDALSREVDGLARTIRSRLQAMEQLMQPGSQQYTMMKSQRTDIARKFRDVVISYHDVQMRLQSSEKQQLERQIRIVNPAASNEDIQRMVDEQSGPVFSQTVSAKCRYSMCRPHLLLVLFQNVHDYNFNNDHLSQFNNDHLSSQFNNDHLSQFNNDHLSSQFNNGHLSLHLTIIRFCKVRAAMKLGVFYRKWKNVMPTLWIYPNPSLRFKSCSRTFRR